MGPYRKKTLYSLQQHCEGLIDMHCIAYAPLPVKTVSLEQKRAKICREILSEETP